MPRTRPTDRCRRICQSVFYPKHQTLHLEVLTLPSPGTSNLETQTQNPLSYTLHPSAASKHRTDARQSGLGEPSGRGGCRGTRSHAGCAPCSVAILRMCTGARHGSSMLHSGFLVGVELSSSRVQVCDGAAAALSTRNGDVHVPLI